MDSAKASVDLLTPHEQRLFLQYVQGISKFSNELPQWIPWWERPAAHGGIEEVCKESEEELEKLRALDLNGLNDFEEYSSKEECGSDGESGEEKECAESVKDKVLRLRVKALPAFRQLRAKHVSPAVKHHIANALHPFLFYCRLYNGCVLDDFLYVAASCLAASEALSGSSRVQQMATCDLACAFALEKLIAIEGKVAKNFSVVSDIRSVFGEREHVLEGLLRLYDLLHRYGVEKGAWSVSKVKQKLIFFMAYVKDNFEEIKEVMLRDTTSIIEREKKELEDKKMLEQAKKLQKEGIIINN